MALRETTSCNNNGKENVQKQRHRNLHYLILNFLQEEGYSNSANTFYTEAKLNNEYQVCDNIDLDIILQDFTSYYMLKFNKRPLICKRNNEAERNVHVQVNKNNSRKNKGNVKNNNRDVLKQEDENTKEELCFTITPLITHINQEKVIESKSTSVPTLHTEEIKPFGNFLKTLSAEHKEIAENIFQTSKFKCGEVKWQDVVGLDNAKRHLREATIYPMKYPQTFQGLLSPWSGILLFGPPGSGKTLVVKALAHEFKRTFFNISASVIVSKWRGDSEKYIKILFDLARYYSPSVIFMDEFEALTSRRDSSHEHEASRRLKHELLIELDGLSRNNENVLFLATTNIPWEVDTAVLRRLEKRLFIPLPNTEAREKIFRLFLEGSYKNESSLQFKTLAEKTEGYSGSDIKVICKEAAMMSIRKNAFHFESGEMLNKDGYNIEHNDLENSISKIKPTAKGITNKYTSWADNFGAE